jgi:phosphoadenosine phosphosulfate reductase
MTDYNKKIDRAIRLLRQIPQDKGPIELAYSGGKDSDCILRLAQMAGIPFDAIYKNTTIDPPGTIAHCKENGVRIINPNTPFLKLIERKGFPTRFRRFCCSELKEYKIHDVCIQGVRRAESTARAARYKEPVICRFFGSKKNHVQVFLPLLEWTDDDVAEFVDRENIKCHPLYYGGAIRCESTTWVHRLSACERQWFVGFQTIPQDDEALDCCDRQVYGGAPHAEVRKYAMWRPL